MWDYDKLFAEGNIVGLKNLQENKVFIKEVHKKKHWKEKGHVNWALYFNSDLSFVNVGNFDFEIQYIVRLDEHGNVVEKLFDREIDMPKAMPELETGMFVRVFWEGFGYIDAVNNRIIYQKGIYSDINEKPGIIADIVEVYGKETCSFNGCMVNKPIWRSPEYQAYLDSKFN